MRAVAGEADFEEDEFVDVEWLRREAAAAVEEIGDFAAAAAFPARDRDVRKEGAALGFEADGQANALDLGGEGGDGRLRFDAAPERAAAALLEPADAAYA